MDVLNNLLFWLHLSALAVGGAAIFGIPIVGSRLGAASAELRPELFGITKALSTAGRAAFAVLIVTGPLLAWLKYGGMAGFNGWFTLKMIFVVLLLISMIFSGILSGRAQRGDGAAASQLPRLGLANVVILLVIVLAAVFAFN